MALLFLWGFISRLFLCVSRSSGFALRLAIPHDADNITAIIPEADMNDKKAQTRERILTAASMALIARGPVEPSVNEIMGAAGLTVGGFYAHFDSKEGTGNKTPEKQKGHSIIE